jgi:hypothetical protein
MANDQQPGIFDKVSNAGSSIGAALMLMGGTPDQKTKAKQILSANAPPGTPPPFFDNPDTSALSSNPPPTSATPGTQSTAGAAGSGLSGFSGIGVNPPGTPIGGAPGLKNLLL